jgi:hypothetical protein
VTAVVAAVTSATVLVVMTVSAADSTAGASVTGRHSVAASANVPLAVAIATSAADTD